MKRQLIIFSIVIIVYLFTFFIVSPYLVGWGSKNILVQCLSFFYNFPISYKLSIKIGIGFFMMLFFNALFWGAIVCIISFLSKKG